MSVWPRIAEAVRAEGKVALVTLTGVQGSAPRDSGAHMVVLGNGDFTGTIGGGALEYQVQAAARALLAEGGPRGEVIRQALGPDLGQCCGGQAHVRIEVFGRDDLGWIAPLAEAEAAQGLVETFGQPDAAGRLIRHLAVGQEVGEARETFGTQLTPLFLFGAGHVGRALVLALAPLPFAVRWVDQRADAFPARVPGNVRLLSVADPQAVLGDAPAGSLVAVMTHSHPLDLAIVSAALADERFPYVGLIGSETKKARFISQMRAAGMGEAVLERLVCPIGGRALQDKAPAVIAAAIAVELLTVRERVRAAT